eukprot:1913349-Prymnesium_polylepis.1
MALADQLSLEKLMTSAQDYAADHFSDMVRARAFRAAHLRASVLEQLLQKNNLVTRDESEVFLALRSWVDAQPATPPDSVTEALLECVRFSQIRDKQFVTGVVETSPLVRKHAFVVMQAYREAIHKEKTTRAVARHRRFASFVEFRELAPPGTKVRVSNDLDWVMAECEKAAPGAEEAVSWDEHMEELVGCVCTVVEQEEEDACDLMACTLRKADVAEPYWFPWHVLERVPQ